MDVSVIRLRSAWLALVCGVAVVAGRCHAQPTPLPSLATPLRVEVLESFPHDPQAFTQGLLLHGGKLYESTGLYGRSSLREVELATGKVLRRVDLPAAVFGEGLALAVDRKSVV